MPASRKRDITPRDVGMSKIVAATLDLLDAYGPQDLTIRQIARAAGHHHRLIIEWFGSKGGLFAAVFEEVFRDLISSGELFDGPVAARSEVKKAFGLFNYMQMHHREFFASANRGFVVEAVEQRFQETSGMTVEQARLAARRIATQVLGLSLFSEFFDLTPEEIKTIEIQELESMRPPLTNNQLSSDHLSGGESSPMR